MEACRFYDIDSVAEWACQRPIPLEASAKKPEARARVVQAESAAEKEPAKKRAAGGGRRR
jgi:cytosine/creatinine deaminase